MSDEPDISEIQEANPFVLTKAQISLAVFLDRKLPANAIRVYGYLYCWRLLSPTDTWPSLRDIAADLELSPDTIKRLVVKLRSRGLIAANLKPDKRHYTLLSPHEAYPIVNKVLTGGSNEHQKHSIRELCLRKVAKSGPVR